MFSFKIHSLTLICLITVFFLSIDAYSTKAISDVRKEELVNYSFATWIGSGVYQVGDRRMAILRVPLRYTLRPPEETTPSLKLLLPVTLGYYDFKNSDVAFGTVTLVPGIEVAFPVNKYWSLKPFGQFGVGQDTAGGNTVYIYGGGVRSLVSIHYKRFVFGIGNSLILANERDTDGDIGTDFNMFEAGLISGIHFGYHFATANLTPAFILWFPDFSMITSLLNQMVIQNTFRPFSRLG